MTGSAPLITVNGKPCGESGRSLDLGRTEWLMADKTKETKSALAVPVTREACDACSISNDFLDVLLTQTVHAAPLSLMAEDQKSQYAAGAGGALIGIQPKGELEGMLAAQLIACHSAAMECYRRAMNSQLPAR